MATPFLDPARKIKVVPALSASLPWQEDLPLLKSALPYLASYPSLASPSTHEPSTQATLDRVYFGMAPVDNLSMQEATDWLLACLQAPRKRPLLVMGPNAYLVTLAQRDSAFAQALRSASLCLADGMSVVWGARLLGRSIKERVPGGEFFEQMCAHCAQAGLSVYLLGGMPGAASRTAVLLTRRYPGLRIAGTDCPPIGFDEDEEQLRAIRTRISAARPDLLCVAFGAPRQEIWMMDHCPTLPIGAALSVGAAFDTQAGLRKRAPSWTHAIGAEWLYRLAMEPRRLWRRYLIGNSQFAGVVAGEWLKTRKERAQRELLRPRNS